MLRPPIQRARLFPRASSGLLSLQRVLETSTRRSMRKLYALKWRLFTSWCGDCRLDPVNCPIGTVLEFSRACSSTGLTHSTLKAYVAALPAYRAPLGGQLVGRHPLVTRFLHSKRKLYTLKWKVSLHGAEVASSTQPTARVVQFWSSCRPVLPQG